MRIIGLLSVLLAFTACSTSDGGNVPGNSSGVSLQAALTATAEEISADDVAGFVFRVYDGPPEDANRTLLEEKFIWLEGESLPDFISPNGDNHSFADAFFTLLPGYYYFTVTPVQDENGTPSEICDSVDGEAEVFESETTELLVISQCHAPDTGGLDVISTLNHEPVIINVEYDDTKFALACQQVCVSITAEDIDGDALSYEFETLSWPEGAHMPTYWAEGNTFCFTGYSDGTYETQVWVDDGIGGSTTLTFPIHVSGEDEAECCADLHMHCDPGSEVFQTVCGYEKTEVAYIGITEATSYITLGADVCGARLYHTEDDGSLSGATLDISGSTNLCDLPGSCCNLTRWNDYVEFIELLPCED